MGKREGVASGKRYRHATKNGDHAHRYEVPQVSDAAVEARIAELVEPEVYGEVDYYRKLGYRERILSLPVMVGVVLAMLWRQIPGVCMLQRCLARERMLWVAPTHVTQASLSERFLRFPAVLFERVLHRVLARVHERAVVRPLKLSATLQKVRSRFGGIYAVDASVLEALFRKLAALREVPLTPLAGQMTVVVELLSHVPLKVWYQAEAGANEKRSCPALLDWLKAGSLVVFDMGYFAFTFFDDLTHRQIAFVTRLGEKSTFKVLHGYYDHPHLRDRVVQLGQYRSNPCDHPVRLIEVWVGGKWQSYLTNVLNPQDLTLLAVLELYDRRWQIEQAFLLVKRLLGLSYLWVGSQNGVQLQLWATWLYYAILIDLCADLAIALNLPLSRISVEMVARSLYFFALARRNGYSDSLVAYLADPANADLGIVKRLRSTKPPPWHLRLEPLLPAYLLALAASPFLTDALFP